LDMDVVASPTSTFSAVAEMDDAARYLHAVLMMQADSPLRRGEREDTHEHGRGMDGLFWLEKPSQLFRRRCWVRKATWPWIQLRHQAIEWVAKGAISVHGESHIGMSESW